MEGGCASSPGIRRPRAASTAARSSSKNAGRIIEWRVRPVAPSGGIRLGLFLGFWIERFCYHLSARLLEQNFHFAFGLFQVFLAITRKLHAFLEQFHSFIQREVRTLQLSDYFFQARQRMLEIGLLRGLGFFRRCWIHGCQFSLPLAAGRENRALD